jgi:ACS family hexuronate transporter-like MFS transporter
MVPGENNNEVRWKIAFLICVASALNYLDRNILAILAPLIQKDLNWTVDDYARITSLFVLSYTFMYAISGGIIDRFGTKWGYACAVGSWSMVSIFHAFAQSVTHFSLLRFFLGVFESANFPAGVKVVSEWFPLRERAFGIGILSAGSAIGATIAIPLVSLISMSLGWRMAFIFSGALGIVWFICWICFYQLPFKYQVVSDDENKISQFSFLKILSVKESWGCISARIFIDPVVYFFIFWIPNYLHDVHGLSIGKMAFTAWVPYTAMGLGTLLGGFLPKWLVENKGISLNAIRKRLMLFSSIFIPVCCYALTIQQDIIMVICLLSTILFLHGLWSNVSLPAEVFPSEMQATITGLGGTFGGIMGFISQYFVGLAVLHFSYQPIFFIIGSAYLVAFILVHFLIGEIGVIKNIH